MKKDEVAEYKIVDSGNNIIDKVTFRVHESGGFDYGNHTATVVEFEKSGNKHVFDTRYFIGTLKDFVEWYEKNELSTEYHFA